jgi:glycosyltransferase involved in cell wall biosynthesis
VRAFSRSGRRLIVAGDGPEYRNLRSIASPNVQFTGRVADPELRDLFSRSRAFVMPGEEDFGITPVESLACGKPVIALGRGGALETVPSFGGVFFEEPREDLLMEAVSRLETMERDIRPVELRAWAERFSEAEFARKMSPILQGTGSGGLRDIAQPLSRC